MTKIRLALVMMLGAISISECLGEAPSVSSWRLFKSAFSKAYNDPHKENVRLGHFLTNSRTIEAHNEKFARGETSFEMGHNPFSDMSTDEFLKTRTGLALTPEEINATLASASILQDLLNDDDDIRLPRTVDWRDKGGVTPVKNQGTCGSCYAFAAAGALETALWRKTHKLEMLSEQNILDCSTNMGNQGCNGGSVGRAYEYIIDNGGIDRARHYPYEGQKGECRFKHFANAGTLTKYQGIPTRKEELLKKVIATIGPVAASIDARRSLQLYKGGIYEDSECKQLPLNHAVIIVGYGVDDGKDYWLIKNSWGSRWGEDGYFKLARNANNMCGITSMASYPII